MNLRYITVSDPREYNAYCDIMRILKSAPNAEVAIQAHASKMSFGMPRREWFDGLLRFVRTLDRHVNLAVHVNLDWANDFCCGKLAPELVDWFFLTRHDGAPVIGRWQINISGSKTPLFQTNKIAQLLQNNQPREFIFQYTAPQYQRMQRLNKTGAPFSVLYDASGGAGQSPRAWRAPLFENHPMGYSGGLSPDNVTDALEKISRVAPATDVWIDAEGKLKDPDTKRFDPLRALQYIAAANNWTRRTR